MDPIVFLKPPKLDPAVWRPDIPLIVIERCLNAPPTAGGERVDPSKLICTWLAIRWLTAAFPKQRGHGVRQIARRAGTHTEGITRWCERLLALGVLEKVGEEEPPRNLSKAKPQPIYAIPLHELERISSEIALDVLIRCGGEAPPPLPAPDSQMTLDFPHSDAVPGSASDRITDQASDRITDQASDRITDQASDRITDQASDRITDQASDRITDHGEGGRVGRVGDHAHAPQRTRGRPRSFPPPPDPPPNAPALPAHPLKLWQDACPRPRPIDAQHLAALAAEHDAATGGHGLYYVGRAILKASQVEDVRSVLKIRKILSRWRAEASYGSDLFEESTDGLTRPVQLTPPPQRARRSGAAAQRGGKHGPTGGSDIHDPGWRDRLIAEAEARARESGLAE
jgi:hypothetical protein